MAPVSGARFWTVAAPTQLTRHHADAGQSPSWCPMTAVHTAVVTRADWGRKWVTAAMSSCCSLQPESGRTNTTVDRRKSSFRRQCPIHKTCQREPRRFWWAFREGPGSLCPPLAAPLVDPHPNFFVGANLLPTTALYKQRPIFCE